MRALPGCSTSYKATGVTELLIVQQWPTIQMHMCVMQQCTLPSASIPGRALYDLRSTASTCCMQHASKSSSTTAILGCCSTTRPCLLSSRRSWASRVNQSLFISSAHHFQIMQAQAQATADEATALTYCRLDFDRLAVRQQAAVTPSTISLVDTRKVYPVCGSLLGGILSRQGPTCTARRMRIICMTRLKSRSLAKELGTD